MGVPDETKERKRRNIWSNKAKINDNNNPQI